MLWLTKKVKKKKQNPGILSLNQRPHFPPASRTMPSHCVFGCPFFCHSGVSARRGTRGGGGGGLETLQPRIQTGFILPHASEQSAFLKKHPGKQRLHKYTGHVMHKFLIIKMSYTPIPRIFVRTKPLHARVSGYMYMHRQSASNPGTQIIWLLVDRHLSNYQKKE